MLWRFHSRTLTFERVRVIGILNVTPDSFSDGGDFFSKEKALERALEMQREGADLIDVGGESTRPGARPVSEEEEFERVLPVIEAIRTQTPIPLSVDTTKPRVAEAALEAGADILNVVDGLNAARNGLAELARDYGAGLVLMHRRGTPLTMQSLAQYRDVVEDVFEELDQSLSDVRRLGVDSDQIVLDPGIGFSKTVEQNLEILAGLKRFHAWGRPVLVGPSRKSFLGALTGKDAGDRDWGTAASLAFAAANGAHLVRVHNVRAMVDVVKVAESIVGAGFKPAPTIL